MREIKKTKLTMNTLIYPIRERERERERDSEREKRERERQI